MYKHELLLSARMVQEKCINISCKYFSHCGCLKCSYFKNKPDDCFEFIPNVEVIS